MDNIRNDLATVINNSGGLSKDEDVNEIKQEHEGEVDLMDEDSIPVPKSEFEVVDSVSGSSDEVKRVDPEELKIAVPRDASSPYDNEWIELTEENIDEVEFKDYDILAFTTAADDEFEIVKAEYDE